MVLGQENEDMHPVTAVKLRINQLQPIPLVMDKV